MCDMQPGEGGDGDFEGGSVPLAEKALWRLIWHVEEYRAIWVWRYIFTLLCLVGWFSLVWFHCGNLTSCPLTIKSEIYLA
ncbi:hypothetical protein BDZ45DRAFT_221532 [Acephala macrosclerotiorum]|nr:hypothetical protein BDZ45DRAFT_221532 [Acephala macrosclerotiorum]